MSREFQFRGLAPSAGGATTGSLLKRAPTPPAAAPAAAPVASGPSSPEAAQQAEALIGALSFASLLGAEIGVADVATELVTLARQAFDNALLLRLANLSVTLCAGKLGSGGIEKYMEELFSAEEMKMPAVELIRCSLVLLEQTNLPNCDWYRVKKAKEILERYANSDDVEVQTRAKDILKMTAKPAA